MFQFLFTVQQKKSFQRTESVFLWETENQIKNQIHQQKFQSASDFDSKTLQSVSFWTEKQFSLRIRFFENVSDFELDI